MRESVTRLGVVKQETLNYFLLIFYEGDNLNMQNADNSVAKTSRKESEPQYLLKRIGSTTYKVSIHFSQTSKETMADIVRRVLEREVDHAA